MVSGRTYPVEVLYRASDDADEEERELSMVQRVVGAIDEAAAMGDGDMLVFFPGEREIRECAEELRKHHVRGEPGGRAGAAVLPLYSRLSAAEQSRVFEPHQGRRIVLSTNVAETSLTVPGIRFVIDPGYARINRYNPRTKVQRLEIEAISRASADQRKGRCGRVGPGVCIRLYGEDDFRARPEFTDPEIVRTNLAAVILQMKSLRLGSVEKFPFVEPPDPRLIKDGYETLLELGALEPDGELTKIGRDLARLPIDPRIGRMLIAAHQENCLRDGLIIASALSIQDPRERPLDAADKADAAHAKFRVEGSDFLGYLSLWNAWKENQKHLSGSKLRQWTRSNFLSFMRMREWDEVHHQLAELAGSMGYRHEHAPPGLPADPDPLHRAVLTGLLSSIGMKSDQGDYLGARGVRFHIFPGSALFKAGPKWVMASEIVRTTRIYARTAAAIKPEWLERIAGSLIRKTHTDPHWDRQSGRVIAMEKGSLFGLELYKGRRVHFGAVDCAPHGRSSSTTRWSRGTSSSAPRFSVRIRP